MALIEFFEVPAGDDDGFLAAWRQESPPDATVFRAIRHDVPVRFVGLSARGGPYAVVRHEGAPEGPGGVILIHPFAAAGERFLDDWDALREAFAGRRGHLGTRLYAAPDTVVHLARWSSPLMVFRAMRDPSVAAAAARIGFPAQPALYQAVGLTP